jgi:ferrous iron transport protein B
MSVETSPHTTSPAKAGVRYVVLTGNPNCGKTTVFNALTGLSAKVGNYAGVTVERKEGRLTGVTEEGNIRVLDLPGTYSLSPNSLDEQISRDVLLNRLPELPAPDVVVVVVDASNLERNLYYATQVIELGRPVVIALNMVDVAENNGHVIDSSKLSKLLGVPIVPMVASTGLGVQHLRTEILRVIGEQKTADGSAQPRLFCQLPGLFRIEATKLSDLLAETFHERRLQATAEGLLILSNERAVASSLEHYPPKVQQAVAAARKRLDVQGVDWRSAPIEWRYARVGEIYREVSTQTALPGETFSDKLDRIVTHKVWGTIIFIGIMALIFQSIFTFAAVPMGWIEAGQDWLARWVAGVVPPGDLQSLLVNGVVAGVGGVVVFLPQILFLFLFIGFLEDTGYMARAAFLMDRLMSKVGLHGKSFIPMLSSFACAIPGIMATRTIESPKDRLVTILVAPLMSCSARLPVYALLIGAVIPQKKIFGFFGLQGLTMLSMYLLGVVMALLMAWLFKKTLLKGETPMLIMELPPYKKPLLHVVLRHMWDRSKLFLRRAGTIILGISIVLWFLMTYPRNPAIEQDFATRKAAEQNEEQVAALEKEQSGEELRHSFAGRMGHFIEPVIAPLGYDWKIGIGIIGSFAAREVFVSTMSTVYNLGGEDSEEAIKDLETRLQEERHPDGRPVYTTLAAISLMVFYVLAMQCVSTVAVVRRETNSWKWPLFQFAYMTVLAWVMAFITYQGGRLLGFE